MSFILFKPRVERGIVIKLWGELYLGYESKGRISFYPLVWNRLRNKFIFDNINIYSPNKSYSMTEQDKVSKYVVLANKAFEKANLGNLINMVRKNTIMGEQLFIADNKYYRVTEYHNV